MHWFTFLILAAFVAVGFYVYRRLGEIEREIRAEQQAMAESSPPPQKEAPATETVEKPQAPAAPEQEAGPVERVLAMVEAEPGLKQTELYARLEDLDRRELQKLLRDLDQQGRLRREKQGSSYRLHPA